MACSERPRAGGERRAQILVGLCSLTVLFLGGAAVTFYYLGNFHDEMQFASVKEVTKAPMAPPMAKVEQAEAAMDGAPVEMKKALDRAGGGGDNLNLGDLDRPDVLLRAPGAAKMEKLQEEKEMLEDVEKAVNKGPAGPQAVFDDALNQDAKEPQVVNGRLVAGKGMPMVRPPAPFGFDMAELAKQPDALFDDRALRRNGEFGRLAKKRDRGGEARAPLPEPFVVRVYAHQHKPVTDGVRRDFTETVYWHPVLILANGNGRVSFDLSDAITRFDVQVWAHGLDGRLGATTTELTSRLPYSVEPKLPIEVTRTDKITIPVAVANDTREDCSVQLNVKAFNLNLLSGADKSLSLEAEKRGRLLFQFEPSCVEGEAKVLFRGSFLPGRLVGADGALRPGAGPAGVREDAVERTFKVVPEGFPVVGSQSDLLERPPSTMSFCRAWVKGTLKLPGAGVPLDPGRPAEGAGGIAARAVRLLRADARPATIPTC